MKLLPKMLTVVIGPVLLGGALGLSLLSQKAGEQAEASELQAQALVDVRAFELSRRLIEQAALLQLLAGSTELRDTLALGGNQLTGTAGAVLERWQAQIGDIKALALVAPDGRLLAAGREASTRLGQVLAAPLAGPQGSERRVLISSALGDPLLLHLLPLSGAKGEPLGVLAAAFSLRQVLAPANESATQSEAQALILDATGSPLAGSWSALAEEQQALAKVMSGDAVIPARLTLPRQQQPVRVWQSTIGQTDWRLVLSQSERDLSAAADAIRYQALLLLAVSLAAGFAGSLLLYRWLMRPLNLLGEAQTRLQNGDQSARAEVLGNDEVAALASSFNRMVESLSAAEQRFRLIFQAFPHPITLTRIGDDKIIDVNPAAEQALGRTRPQLIGSHRPPASSAEEQQLRQTQAQQLLSTGRIDGLTVQLSRPDSALGYWGMLSSRLIKLDGESVALSVLSDISELKRAEELLRQSELSFMAIFQSAPVPMAYSPVTEGLTQSHWNEAWYRCFGYTAEQVEGLGGSAFGLWVDPAARADFVARLQSEGEISGLQVALRRADGQVRLCEVSGRYIVNQGTQLILSIYLDLTDRLAAEQALRDSESQLQALLAATPVAVLISDAEANYAIVTANEAWLLQFGYTLEAVAGFTSVEPSLWVDPEQRAAMLQAVRQAGAVAGLEVEYRRSDGSKLLCRVSARLVTVGAKLLLVTVQQDISESRAALLALQASEARYRRLHSSMIDGFVASDLQGRLTDSNAALQRMLGYTESELLGMQNEQLTPPKWHQMERDLIKYQVRLDGHSKVYEKEFIHFDGHALPVELRTYLETDEEGRPVGYWAIVRDITERKRSQTQMQQLNASLEGRVLARTQELAMALESLKQTQQELVRSEKLAGLGALVAGVAHELNTPIGNAVMMASTLLDQQRDFSISVAQGLRRSTLESFMTDTQQAAEMLLRSLHRAAELVRSFKQVAVDQSSYQRRSFKLQEVAQEIAATLQPSLRKAKVALINHIGPELELDSYPGPLGQVLMNLINNAMAHGFDMPRPDACVQLRAERLDGERLRLLVEDNGSGIAAEHLPRVFDPFFTTKLGQGGSGLGLHIVYSLVTGLLGGQIALNSEVGRGTIAVIELPLRAPQKDETTPP
ncbi:PAS domain S-box protein [Paucibacter sp. AS339]|uniref:PAS domain S-box protein n=1 Tax=Paucibacter hankyongi TaxID=3133434 RepID=UPI0030A0C6E9